MLTLLSLTLGLTGAIAAALWTCLPARGGARIVRAAQRDEGAAPADPLETVEDRMAAAVEAEAGRLVRLYRAQVRLRGGRPDTASFEAELLALCQHRLTRADLHILARAGLTLRALFARGLGARLVLQIAHRATGAQDTDPAPDPAPRSRALIRRDPGLSPLRPPPRLMAIAAE